MRNLAKATKRTLSIIEERGAWVAKAVKHVTLDFHSGHDLWVLGSSPMSFSALSGYSALGSPLFSSALPHSCHLSLSQNKINKSLSKSIQMKEKINYMQMVDLCFRVITTCEAASLTDDSGHCHGLVLGKERGQSG